MPGKAEAREYRPRSSRRLVGNPSEMARGIIGVDSNGNRSVSELTTSFLFHPKLHLTEIQIPVSCTSRDTAASEFPKCSSFWPVDFPQGNAFQIVVSECGQC